MPYTNNCLNSKLLSTTVIVTGSAFIGLCGYLLYRSYLLYDKRSCRRAERVVKLKRYKRNDATTDAIERRLDQFKFGIQMLRQIMEIFERDLKKGLESGLSYEADLKMLPTYVCDLPTGKEVGNILALDLGGSNFRVVLVRLKPHTKPEMKDKVFILSDRLMKGPGEKLFDHMAMCLSQFMHYESLDLTKTYPLGFTFSFPVKHSSISKAILLRWTKCFNCSDTINRDVVEMLQNAIDKRNDIKVKVASLINDTVGTLMSCAYKDQNAAIGLIVGTGTNACYFENIKNIKALVDANNDDFVSTNATKMLVNTEWGAFGESGSIEFIRTRYDDEIDKTSINIGMQIFEKMISGMYLGEIARLTILDLIDSELIFKEEMKLVAYRHALFTKGSFYAKYIHEIESDSELTYANTKRIMLEIAGIDKATNDDYAVIKYVCELISERAAKLTAAALAVIINRLNHNKVTIAVDGSLFRYHPNFQPCLESTLSKLVNPNIEFEITLSADGSGRGAAVVAAIATKEIRTN